MIEHENEDKTPETIFTKRDKTKKIHSSNSKNTALAPIQKKRIKHH